MKTVLRFLTLFLFTLHWAIGQSDCTPIPEVDFPGGRIVMSFDGNVHDDDDIVAMAYSAGLWWAAGLKEKVVQFEYNNHICDTGVNETDGAGAGAGDDSQNMRETAAGAISQFGYNANLFYDYERQGSASTAKMAAEIEKSTASNPLWIIAAGPMETVWRGLERANKGFDHVTIISHSRWNERHTHCSGAHDWNDLKRGYQNKGVFFVENCDDGGCGSPNKLNDQNGGFNSTKSNWYWMRDSDKEYNRWIYGRNPFSSSKFDPSDAGMSYFLITGGPFDGGNKTPDHNDARKLMENPCQNTNGPSEEEQEEEEKEEREEEQEEGTPENTSSTFNFVSPSDGANYATGETITIDLTATSNGGNIVKYQVFVNNRLVDTDPARFTPYRITNAKKGAYTLRAEATESNGNKTVKSVSIRVGSNENDDNSQEEQEEVEEEGEEEVEEEEDDGEVEEDKTGEDNGNSDSEVPSFAFVSPSGGTNYAIGKTITVNLSATKGSDIVKYQIFVNNKLVDTDPANFTPYRIVNTKKGTYTIRAEATNRKGSKAVKTVVVSVGGKDANEEPSDEGPSEGNPPANSAPIRLSVSPDDGSYFVEGASVSVGVSASSAGSSIVKHKIYVNGSLVDTDPAYFTPYRITNLKRGTYTVKVEVFDKKGRTATKTLQFKVGNRAVGLVARVNIEPENLVQGEDLALRIAPNPIEGFQMNVFQKSSSDLRITNVYGVLVRQIDAVGETEQIDVAGLAPGVYILESDTGSAKFIVPD